MITYHKCWLLYTTIVAPFVHHGSLFRKGSSLINRMPSRCLQAGARSQVFSRSRPLVWAIAADWILKLAVLVFMAFSTTTTGVHQINTCVTRSDTFGVTTRTWPGSRWQPQPFPLPYTVLEIIPNQRPVLVLSVTLHNFRYCQHHGEDGELLEISGDLTGLRISFTARHVYAGYTRIQFRCNITYASQTRLYYDP